MNRRYRLIDEGNYNLLGTFASRGEALDCVAALLAVNTEDFLEELTIADERGPLLSGDALRVALERRAQARTRISASSGGGSNGAGGSSDRYGALAAKGHD
jgi:hypothetical protein